MPSGKTNALPPKPRMIMKTKVTILMIFLVIGINTNAQVKFYSKVSLDPKMLTQGPHPDNKDFASSSLDIEIQGGIEIEKNFRFSMAYQSHEEIEFRKFSYAMLDYGLIDLPFKNINCYIGIEAFSTFRQFPDAKPTDTYWRTKEASPFLLGANAEIQYMPFNNLGLSGNLNLFRAEPALTRYGKEIRWEVMIGVVFKTGNYYR